MEIICFESEEYQEATKEIRLGLMMGEINYNSSFQDIVEWFCRLSMKKPPMWVGDISIGELRELVEVNGINI